jgi:hypothetical protein
LLFAKLRKEDARRNRAPHQRHDRTRFTAFGPCFLVGLDLERDLLTSFSALPSEKIDWRPAGKRDQPLGKHDEHHESEHQKERRNVLLDVGAMKATFSGHGASTSLLVL